MTQKDYRVHFDAIIDELGRLAAQLEALRQRPHVPKPISTTYVTADEAREYLRFKTMKGLYRWASSHAIPKCRRGRCILFLRSDLDEAVGNRARQKRTEAGRVTR